MAICIIMPSVCFDLFCHPQADLHYFDLFLSETDLRYFDLFLSETVLHYFDLFLSKTVLRYFDRYFPETVLQSILTFLFPVRQTCVNLTLFFPS